MGIHDGNYIFHHWMRYFYIDLECCMSTFFQVQRFFYNELYFISVFFHVHTSILYDCHQIYLEVPPAASDEC